MSRAPRSVASHARRKKVFKQAKGFYGRRKNTITSANAAVDRSLQHNYIGRKEKKRNFRALWIQRINAGCRLYGITYSRFISGLAKAGIEIDRKVLSDLAPHEPEAFKALVDQAGAKAEVAKPIGASGPWQSPGRVIQAIPIRVSNEQHSNPAKRNSGGHIGCARRGRIGDDPYCGARQEGDDQRTLEDARRDEA